MDDFKKIMTSKTHTVKCYKCGKKLEIPNMMNTKTRDAVLSPYCCTSILFTVQWILHHGWHIRNLGITDSHPYFCPECWEEGSPEYIKAEHGEAWCKQAQAWLDSTKEITEP